MAAVAASLAALREACLDARRFPDGASTSTFITLNVETNGFSLVARGMFGSAILLCYPLNIYPAIQSLELFLGIGDSLPSGTPRAVRCWRALYRNAARSLGVGGAYGFALVARDAYDTLSGLTGGLCAVPLAFIFPGLCHYKLFAGEQSAAASAVDIGLVIFGSVMAPIAVVIALITWK